MFLTLLLTLPRVAACRALLARRTRRLGARFRREGSGPDCRPGIAGVRIDRIDDPDGTTRIVRIVGAVSSASLPHIFDAWSDVLSPHLVHIDLADAVIMDLPTMMSFEQAIDHLERQDIGIRIVGLDPTHPALAD